MARIAMTAKLPGASVLVAGLPHDELSSIVVDTLSHTLEYVLHPNLALQRTTLAIHGFVPPGWSTVEITRLPNTSQNGVWQFDEWQTKNILAGLSYITATFDDGRSVRAQIEQQNPQAAVFEDYVTLGGITGACATTITIPGVCQDLPLAMEPAQVLMARSAASTMPDGRREQTIGCAIRVGGAQAPGIGRLEIQMYQDENPGHIVSMQSGADFPARMTLDVRKRYITPMGTFYSEREEFEAVNIERFPPFGVKFTPIKPTAALKDEKTGAEVGHINLGWLVPLCYLDPANFPPKAFPTPVELP
ncbi:hypothetical protein BjapCC829_19225 [Bradyrhizobium barranii]|uniref:Uncharacterized protein n=1 Tax=Bradyrhizobium barranii TaxID=2992140 RepID=A0ABY3QWX2_9BRAD|nr:hypothetical protein [Bradyrhizobium japonicum]UFW90546.1 hypothetical protein BjapCC829_19225 [Bradyrhizobium japonicum]